MGLLSRRTVISVFRSFILLLTIVVCNTNKNWLSLAKKRKKKKKKDVYLLKFRCCLFMFQKEQTVLRLGLLKRSNCTYGTRILALFSYLHVCGLYFKIQR